MSNDHLVSKTYLKWFEDADCNKLHCSFYQLVRGELQWTNVKQKNKEQICYEIDRFFQETEEVFQVNFENEWNDFIEYLNKFNFAGLKKRHYKKNRILNSSQVALLLNFIITHHKRKKKVKEDNKSHPAVIENLKKYEETLGRKLTDEEVEEFHKKVDNFFMIEPQESIKYLKKRPWLLCVNISATPFITSSSPVIWHDEMNIGIYTPLSPQFAIIIPLTKHKEKSGIIIESITEKNTIKFNKFMQESLVKNNADKPIIISNSTETIEGLVDI